MGRSVMENGPCVMGASHQPKGKWRTRGLRLGVVVGGACKSLALRRGGDLDLDLSERERLRLARLEGAMVGGVSMVAAVGSILLPP